MKIPGLDTLKMKGRVRNLFRQTGASHTLEALTVISRFDHEEPRIYLIDEGTVTLQLADQEGNSLTVIHLVAGELFGLLDHHLIEGVNQIQLSAHARSECSVIEVKRSQLLGIGRRDPEVLLAVSSELSKRFSEVVRKVGQFAFYDVRGRISSALLDLCQLPDAVDHPDGYVVKATRIEIAMMVGCTRELVGRIMQDMNNEGLISVLGRKTLIRHDIRTD
ncbi:CRP/FNR family cyclic AMP-dependent transcriptional regulator [Pseudomonas frederiksbergensis]|uniref:helix-turn-helix domain-containing protein n=1 Tax=Pseudomonas TaxID=286 RepID=UPI003D1B2B7F